MNKRNIFRLLANNRLRPVQIDEGVSFFYVSRIILENVVGLIRGFLKTGRLLVVGRGARLRNVGGLCVGKGVRVKEFCLIDCSGQEGIVMGDGVSIGAFSRLQVSGSLRFLGKGIWLGNNVGIGDFSHIGGSGGVVIGDDTITGAYLSIHPENHETKSLDVPIRMQGVSRKGISIGPDCWIGSKVTFLDGSEVGAGCVVAAGSVVTKRFGSRKVIAGVPARVIKERS